VFDLLLPDPISEVLRNRQVITFMMVCGGLVSFPKFQEALVKVVNS
jgi:hypothetical protein